MTGSRWSRDGGAPRRRRVGVLLLIPLALAALAVPPTEATAAPDDLLEFDLEWASAQTTQIGYRLWVDNIDKAEQPSMEIYNYMGYTDDPAELSGDLVADLAARTITGTIIVTWACTNCDGEGANRTLTVTAGLGNGRLTSDGDGWRVSADVAITYTGTGGFPDFPADCGGVECWNCEQRFCKYDETITSSATLTGTISGTTLGLVFADRLSETPSPADVDGLEGQYFVSRVAITVEGDEGGAPETTTTTSTTTTTTSTTSTTTSTTTTSTTVPVSTSTSAPSSTSSTTSTTSSTVVTDTTSPDTTAPQTTTPDTTTTVPGRTAGKSGGVAGGVLGGDDEDPPSKRRTATGAAVLGALAAVLAEGIRQGVVRGKAAELYRKGLEKIEKLNQREQELQQKLERLKDRVASARERLDAKVAGAQERLIRRQERALHRLQRHRERLFRRLERIKRRAQRKLAERTARGRRRVRELRNRLTRRWDRARRRFKQFNDRMRVVTSREVRQREMQRVVRRLLSRNPTAQTLLAAGVTDEKAVVRMLDRLRRDPRREIRRAFRTLEPRRMGQELRRTWRRMTRRNPAARATKWVFDRLGDLFRGGRRRPRGSVG